MTDNELNKRLAEKMGYEVIRMDDDFAIIEREDGEDFIDYTDPAIVLENIKWLGEHHMYLKKENGVWYVRRCSKHLDCIVCKDKFLPKAVAMARCESE